MTADETTHEGEAMNEHDDYREDLADYASSRLDADRAGAVERHLGECDDCRRTASFMKDLGEAIGDAGDALFEPHPDVDVLRRYALGDATDDAARIARHLQVCPSCDLESTAWPVVRAMETGGASGGRVAYGPWLRRVAGPWLAAAAGLVLGVALTYQVTSQRPVAPTEVAFDRPAQHLMIPGAVRGSAPELTFTLSGDGSPVVLDLQPVIPGQAGEADEFTLTIRSEGAQSVWSAVATASEMRRALDAAGVVTFVVPARALTAGRHEIALTAPGADAAPIFRATIEIERP